MVLTQVLLARSSPCLFLRRYASQINDTTAAVMAQAMGNPKYSSKVLCLCLALLATASLLRFSVQSLAAFHCSFLCAQLTFPVTMSVSCWLCVLRDCLLMSACVRGFCSLPSVSRLRLAL